MLLLLLLLLELDEPQARKEAAPVRRAAEKGPAGQGRARKPRRAVASPAAPEQRSGPVKCGLWADQLAGQWARTTRGWRRGEPRGWPRRRSRAEGRRLGGPGRAPSGASSSSAMGLLLLFLAGRDRLLLLLCLQHFCPGKFPTPFPPWSNHHAAGSRAGNLPRGPPLSLCS